MIMPAALAAAALFAVPAAADSQSSQPPLESPPFPSSDWLGPFPEVGVADSTPDYPLQQAIFGNSLKDSRIKVYGWINPSINISTSQQSNVPDAYDVVPNHLELDQLVLRIERMPDTTQNKHIDWGFRLTNMYGLDYRYTTAKGWLSDQLIKRNNLYGYDPIEAYGMLYVPGLFQGVIFKLGRYISPPDIEAQLAPDNYLFTHSLMFSYDPFTFTGLTATIKLNAYWSLLVGAHAGNDMAPWADSAQPNATAMVRWVSRDGNDSIWFGLNSLGANKFNHEHDNLRILAGTWGHRFNDRWHMMTEAYDQGEFDGALGGSCIDGPVEPYGGGGGCGATIPGFSWSVGFVNYLQYLIAKTDYVSLRNDFLDDPQGQRTGFKTWYTSHTIGWVHYFNDLLFVRPELRYDRAYDRDVTPYDNGTKRTELKFAADMVLRF